MVCKVPKNPPALSWEQYSERRDKKTAFAMLCTAHHEAGRAVAAWKFGRPVNTILSCCVGGSGKRFLPSLDDWSAIPQCSDKVRFMQEKRLRVECLKLLAGQAAESCYRENALGIILRNDMDVFLSKDVEVIRAIELVSHVMDCPKESAEIFISNYYMPDAGRYVREPKIWDAIEKVVDALINAPQDYITAEDVYALLARITKERKAKEREERDQSNRVKITADDAH